MLHFSLKNALVQILIHMKNIGSTFNHSGLNNVIFFLYTGEKYDAHNSAIIFILLNMQASLVGYEILK